MPNPAYLSLLQQDLGESHLHWFNPGQVPGSPCIVVLKLDPHQHPLGCSSFAPDKPSLKLRERDPRLHVILRQREGHQGLLTLAGACVSFSASAPASSHVHFTWSHFTGSFTLRDFPFQEMTRITLWLDF